MTSGKVKRGRDVIQEHHLEYMDKTGPSVLLYRGEHWAITQLQRRKKISKGFLKALRYWIDSIENDAVELSNA